MINSVVLVGRLVKDSELRYTPNNKAVGNFTLAVNRNYKNQNGEYETDFIKCTIFGKSAEALNKYVHKGDILGVEGSMQTRQYEDKEGNKKSITEVLIEKIHFINQSKTSEYKKEDSDKEENEYKDMSIKVESNIELDKDVKLPWEE